MYNPQLATWRTSPAANEIERHTLAWLGGKFGLPAGASASFTSGGAGANLSAGVGAVNPGFSGHGGTRGGRVGGAPPLYPAGGGPHTFNKVGHMAGRGRPGG